MGGWSSRVPAIGASGFRTVFVTGRSQPSVSCAIYRELAHNWKRGITMDNRMTITDVTGPYREPREQVLSYDYSIQRASWPTAQAVRVKVAIPEELDVLRSKILGAVAGTPGQQLMISKFLSRHIADEKIRIADTDGMLAERRDTVVAPFTGPLAHLFARLDAWAVEQQKTLRAEIKTLVGL